MKKTQLGMTRERYDQIIENLYEGIWVADKDAYTTFVNARMAEMLGYTTDEMVGRHLFSFADEHNMAIASRTLERRKRGIKEQHELELVRKDGTSVHMLMESAPLSDDEGNYIGSITGVLDITERKRTEQLLQDSEKRFRELVDLLPQTVFEIDEQGNFTFANYRGFQSFGYTLEDFDKGLNALQMVIPQDRDRATENIQKVLSGEESGGVEYVALRKDGSTFPIIIYSAPIHRGDKIVGLRGVIIDITERKRAEEALRESEEKYREIVGTSIDGVVSVDSQMKILVWNQGAERIFGYTGNEMLGQTLMKIVPERYREAMLKGFAQFMRTGSGPVVGKVLELDSLTKKGEEVPIELSLASRKVGETYIATAVIRDITERKQIEGELRESEKHYRLLADNVTDIIFTMDMNLRYTYISPSVTCLSGYSVEEATGQTLQEVLTAASFKVAMDAFAEEEVLEDMGGKSLTRSRTLRLEMYRKDGSTFWAEVRMTALRDQDDQPVGFVGVARDITERILVEESLK